MKRKFSIFFFLLIGIAYSAEGQRFLGSASIGINASQIDGDDYAGYSKLGLTAGIRTDYYFKPNISLGVELLFSQRGAQSSFSFGTPTRIQRIHMNYLELPILINIHDWYIEEDKYYKVRAELGLSLGNQFTISSKDSFFDAVVDDFNKRDLSYIIGFTYRFNKRFGITARYTRALTNLYRDDLLLARPLSSYFITFKVEYHF